MDVQTTLVAAAHSRPRVPRATSPGTLWCVLGFFCLLFIIISFPFSSPRDTHCISPNLSGFNLFPCHSLPSGVEFSHIASHFSSAFWFVEPPLWSWCRVGRCLCCACFPLAFNTHGQKDSSEKKKRSNISFLHPLECRPGWSFSELRWSRCWWSLDLSSSETRVAFRRSTLTKYNQ